MEFKYNRAYKTKYAHRCPTVCGRPTYSDIEQFLLGGMSLEEISRHVNLRLNIVRIVVEDILEQKRFLEEGVITLKGGKVKWTL